MEHFMAIYLWKSLIIQEKISLQIFIIKKNRDYLRCEKYKYANAKEIFVLFFRRL